ASAEAASAASPEAGETRSDEARAASDAADSAVPATPSAQDDNGSASASSASASNASASSAAAVEAPASNDAAGASSSAAAASEAAASAGASSAAADKALDVESADASDLAVEAGGIRLAEQAFAADGDEQPVGVIYRVVELKLDDLKKAGYEPRITNAENGSFTITNVHAPETRDLVAKKLWVGADAPTTPIVVQLLANGAPAGEAAQLGPNNNWTHSWKGMPKNAAGKAIAYSVDEVLVPSGFTPAIVSDGDTFTITNTFNKQVKTVTVIKRWLDEKGNAMNAAPVATTYTLSGTADGAPITVEDATRTMAAGATGDALTVSWADLPAFQGAAITYDVQESAISGYTMVSKERSENSDGVVITFTNKKNADTPTPPVPPEPDTYSDSVIMVTYVDYLNEPGDLKSGDSPTQLVAAYKVEEKLVKPKKLDAKAGTNIMSEYYTDTTESVVNEDDSGTGRVQTQAEDDAAITAQADRSASRASAAADEALAQGESGSIGSRIAAAASAAKDAASSASATSAADQAGAGAAAGATAGVGADLGTQASNQPGVVPADPSHEGHTFVKWDVNRDQYGNYVMVAQYARHVTVSYIDPQSGKIIYSTVTGDPDSVQEPSEKPTADGLEFVEWVKVVDPAGNVVWVAKYKPEPCECDDNQNCDTPSNKTSERTTVRPAPSNDTSQRSTTPSTGDALLDTAIVLGIAAALAALALIVVFLRMRSKRKDDPDRP
ncbi:MAG TPA: hypothetical protein DCP91_00860, partial [Eggerthellaceae bacterium]|nr:hypothetical protein [Eggerthellaceae bacterium]